MTLLPGKFLLDYEEEEDEDSPSRRKKPWRYRWPDDFRDEVWARLLELTKRRAEAEQVAGKLAKGGKRKVRKKGEEEGELF